MAKLKSRGKKGAGGAKKKKQLTAKQLVQQAQDYITACDPESAFELLKEAERLEKDNVDVVDALGELYFELGQPDEAKEYFSRSINLAPESGAAKWLYLGQLSEGKQAEEMFLAGIKLLQRDLENVQLDTSEEATNALRKQIASAYCSLADLYMTDLCFEDDAEQKCEEYAQTAVKADPLAPEPLQTMASLRMSQQRPEDAKELLQKVYSHLSTAEVEDLPPAVFRICTGKILIEVEEYDKAADVLEGVMAEDDENIELWYLVGMCYHRTKQYVEAKQFLLTAKRMFEELREVMGSEFTYEQQQASVEELLQEVESEAAAAGVSLENTEAMERDDDSEYEDIEDEEEEDDAAMTH